MDTSSDAMDKYVQLALPTSSEMLLTHTHSTSSLSPLEKLPLEIFYQISEELTFFDKKSVQILSKQMYYATGPLECPNPLSWIMHVCWTARNTDIYDYSVLNAQKTVEVLKAMVEQLGTKEEMDDTATTLQGPSRSMLTKAQAVPMEQCSKDIWISYFSGVRLDCLRDGFHFATLGIFMLHNIRAYLQRRI